MPPWELLPLPIFSVAASAAEPSIDAARCAAKMNTMNHSSPPQATAPAPAEPLQPQPVARRRPLHRTLPVWAAGLLLSYALVAYLLMPLLWEIYIARHPALQALPGITHTRAGISGDPLNLALIGTEAEVLGIMRAADWVHARPLGLRSDLKLAQATVLKRPDDDAPVSSLYLFGRREDLAFEQPVGHDPRQRHHVRLWRAPQLGPDDRPLWVGAATFDQGVGLSHNTGQITHHIAADVDAERDHVLQSLVDTDRLVLHFLKSDFHQVLSGRNGGGDRWFTDGGLAVGLIAPDD